jgi:hypothetical protein
MTGMLQDCRAAPHHRREVTKARQPYTAPWPLPIHCRDADRNRARPRPGPVQRLFRAVGDGAGRLAQEPAQADGENQPPRRAGAAPCRGAGALPVHRAGRHHAGDAEHRRDRRRCAGRPHRRRLHDGSAAWLEPYARVIGIVLGFVLISFIQIVIGELVPKRLALSAPGTLRPTHGDADAGAVAAHRTVRVAAEHVQQPAAAPAAGQPAPRRGDRRRDPPAGGRKRRTGRARSGRTQHGQPRAAPGRSHGGQRDDAAHAHRLAGHGGTARKTSRCCGRRRTRAIRCIAATRATWSAWSRSSACCTASPKAAGAVRSPVQAAVRAGHRARARSAGRIPRRRNTLALVVDEYGDIEGVVTSTICWPRWSAPARSATAARTKLPHRAARRRQLADRRQPFHRRSARTAASRINCPAKTSTISAPSPAW